MKTFTQVAPTWEQATCPPVGEKEEINCDELAEMSTTQGPIHVTKLIKSQYVTIRERIQARPG